MQKRILYLISYIALCIQLHDCFAEKDHAYVKDHSLNSNQVAKQQGVELNLELDYNAVQNVSQYNLLEYDLNIEDGKDYDNSFELAIILEDIDTKLQTPRSNNQKFYKAKDRSVSDEYDNDQKIEFEF